MRNPQLDELTRMVASGSPRRRVLGSLAAILATPLLPRSANLAEAACKKVGKNCNRGKDCCDKARCKSGKCRCKDGYKSCGGQCKKLDKDEQHCGRCNASCPAGQRCCDGGCVDRQTDRSHCGTCGNECSGTKACIAGACVNLAGTCAPGSHYCLSSQPQVCGDPETCRCTQSTEGETVCGYLLTEGKACGQCQTSADCASLGPGAYCMDTRGDSSCCGPSLSNVCMLPCPALISR